VLARSSIDGVVVLDVAAMGVVVPEVEAMGVVVLEVEAMWVIVLEVVVELNSGAVLLGGVVGKDEEEGNLTSILLLCRPPPPLTWAFPASFPSICQLSPTHPSSKKSSTICVNQAGTRICPPFPSLFRFHLQIFRK